MIINLNKNKNKILFWFHENYPLSYQHNLNTAIHLLCKRFDIYVYDKYNGLNINLQNNVKKIDKTALININFKIVITSFYQDIFNIKGVFKGFKNNDFNDIIILNVWHGAPIRKICFDNNIEKVNLLLKFKKNNVYHVVPNSFYREVFKTAFNVNDDVIFENAYNYPQYSKKFSRKKILNNTKRLIRQNKKILFCPTFDPKYQNRNFFDRFPILKDFEKKSKNKYTLYIKCHELDSSVISSNSKNIVLLPNNFDLTENFSLYDYFITDISSTIFEWHFSTSRKFCFIKPENDYLDRNETYFKIKDIYKEEFNTLEGILNYFENDKATLYETFLKKIQIDKKNHKKNLFKLINHLISK